MRAPGVAIRTFVDPLFAENAYLITAPTAEGHQVGWVIDPGLDRQIDELLAHIDEQQVTIDRIILTHGHADHIAGLDRVRERHPGARVLMAAADQPMLTDPELNLSSPFGFEVRLATAADEDLVPGTELWLGDSRWLVLDTSGHSPGGRSLYCAQAGGVITGDALFSQSIGRTDFPGSSSEQLLGNIRAHLLTLPDETVVYSGHGPTTTIGKERKFNPYLSDAYRGE